MNAIKNFLLGNKMLQKFWWRLYKISLKGMNYDRGHVPFANGEPFALKFAVEQLKNKKPFVLFDVGANRGQYLQMIFKEIKHHSDFRIFCFEPQKDAFQSLNAIAGDSPNVVTENIALSNNAGTSTLYKNSSQSEYASLYPANYKQYNTKLSLAEEIKMITLDAYCKSHGIAEIDFLKIDVEGHEIEVLKGASGMLDRGKIQFIQFEFGLASIESRIFLKDFFELLIQYEIYRILPGGLERIIYSEYSELFLTTNYIAKKM
jgi:FkbM family methyltransferase